jgi:nucleoside-diphosphate-sugar epimerase
MCGPESSEAGWRGKKALVTGAGGFIDSQLAEALVRAGAATRALVHYNALGNRGWLESSDLRSDMEIIAGDICDPGSVREAMRGTEVVFHLAALIAIPYSYRAPESYVRTNIHGTLNVLQAVRDLGCERMVHTSTSEIYGTARYAPIDRSMRTTRCKANSPMPPARSALTRWPRPSTGLSACQWSPCVPSTPLARGSPPGQWFRLSSPSFSAAR